MKRFKLYYRWIIGLTISLALVHPAAAQAILHHELFIQLDPSGHGLKAEDIITVPPDQKSSMVFELADHVTVQRVTLDRRKVPFSFNGGRLRISMSPHSDSRQIGIYYSGVYNDAVPAEPLNTDNPGYGVTGTISPRGTMLLAGARWYPDSIGMASRYTLTVDAPEGVVAVTAGSPLGHASRNGQTRSRWSVDHPVGGLPLVAGPYEVSLRRFGNVSAATYFSQPLQHLSDSYLNATGRYLELYQELFGPYAYGQFAVVENFFPTGYGFPSFSLLGRRVLQLPFIIHTSLGHEIAHCWWGNGVLVDASQGNWSEGLTTYVADYLYKERRGQGRDYRRQWLRNYAGLVDDGNDFPAARFMSRIDPVTKVVGYDKVAMVFHMLRRSVGDEAFWQTLREIYRRHRFQAIAWSDIQTAFEHRTGHSLDRFFSQWVRRSGAPQLALKDVTVAPEADGFNVRGAVVQQKPYFDVSMTLTLTAGPDKVSQNIQVSGSQTPFSFMVTRRPTQLAADPDVDLFRRLWPQEVPPTINDLRGAPSVHVVVAQNLEAGWLKIAERLCAALGIRQTRIGREGDFAMAALKQKDVLFMGRPTKAPLLPVSGYPFDVKPDAFTLKDRKFADGSASFFGVFAHPQNRERIVALFLPHTLETAGAVAAKIPHYGKYSYLVFNQTRNQVKGTWMVENSPMVVRWP
ncbi:MAG: M1 family aminopeptidase [Desulfobacteraceae bacterium]|jgi:hypothetical protein